MTITPRGLVTAALVLAATVLLVIAAWPTTCC